MNVEGLISAHRDELVELTRDLVAAPSPNPPGDERATVPVLERYLAGVDGVELGIFAERSERPTLVAAIGSGPPTLAIAAHIDTHAVGDGWTTDPAGELRGERLFGRGSTDNKGAVAAMSLVFRLLADQRGLPDGARLVLIANADEETGGEHGIASLCRSWNETPDAVVVAEPSGIFEPWESLWIAARGTIRFTVRATGTDTHSSLAGRSGVASAIERLDELLATMTSRLGPLSRDHPPFGRISRMTVVSVNGGSGWGNVPAQATVDCELRVGPGVTEEQVTRDLETVFEEAKALTDVPAEVTYPPGGLRWMAPSSTPIDAPIVAAAELAWSKVFGKTPALGCFPGGTDARLFEAAGIPTVIAGPGALVRAHHSDEYVTVDELCNAARLYATTIDSFFTHGSGDRP